MVGSDHFHQLWLDNMPQFLVGKAPYFDANFYNEEREFGLPRMTLPGQEDLAAHILRNGLDADFDLAFSNELRIDHSITCPIITLRPQADLPIVPIYTNIFAPPMPQPRRFVELGRTIRELVETLAVGPAGGDHRHRSPVAGARRTAAVRPARSGSGVRPQGGGVDRHRRPRRLPGRGDAGQPAPAGQRDPRVHGLHADDGRGRRGREGRSRRHARPVPHHGGLLHLVPERSARHEQVPAGQVPLHRRPRPGAGRALPRRPGRHGELVGAGDGQPDPQLHGRGEVDLAGLHRRGAPGAARTRSCRAVRDGRASVPDPDPVHRDVRTGPRAAGIPDGLRHGRMEHLTLPYPDIAT